MLVLNSRLKQLLEELLDHDSPISGEYLAKQLGVTSRTIRNDVKTLNMHLKNTGVSVKANKRLGYFVDPINDSSVRYLLKNIFENEEKITPTFPEDRVLFILKRLIMSDDFIASEQLADILYVSKSTIDNDVKQIEALLKRYNLCLLKKPNYGIKLMGAEIDLRFCLSECFTSKQNDHLFSEFCVFEDFLDIIRWHTETLPLKIAQIPLNNLAIHLLIAVYRIKRGKNIQSNTISLAPTQEHPEYDTAHKIAKSLEDKFEISMPKEEIYYITIHLLGAKYFSRDGINNDGMMDFLGETTFRLISDILFEINKVYNIDLQDDKELLHGLGLHLKSAVHRLKYRMNLRNPMLKDVKKKYPFAFELGVLAADVIRENNHLLVNEDEIAYIAVHLGAAVERMRNNKKRQLKRVGIVCAYGLGIAKLLETDIESRFPEIKIVGIYPYYSEVRDDVDLIISTSSAKADSSVPVIYISPILTEDDIHKISTHILSKYHNEDKNKTISKMQDLFHRELFFTEIHKESPNEVIQSLSAILNILGYVDDKFGLSVLEREEISSTSIGNLVAIPHALKPNARNSCIAVCILENPIKWGGQQVQLIFLLSLKYEEKGEFKHLFNHLLNLAHQKKLVNELCQKKDFSEFMTKFYSLKG